MRYRVSWDPHRSIGTVINAEPTGMPYLGVVRKQDLLDGFTASSTLRANHVELGVFGSEDEAVEAIVREAVSLLDRRATNASIARVPAGSIPRVTGAGGEIDAPGVARRMQVFANLYKPKGRVRLDVDLVVDEDGHHCEEAQGG